MWLWKKGPERHSAGSFENWRGPQAREPQTGSRSWKGKKMDSLLELPGRKAGPRTVILLRPISEFWPPELEDNTLCCFKTTTFLWWFVTADIKNTYQLEPQTGARCCNLLDPNLDLFENYALAGKPYHSFVSGSPNERPEQQNHPLHLLL